MSNSYDVKRYVLKYIIVGDSSVGKTCLVNRLTNNTFNSQYDLTIGVEFGSYNMKIDDNEIKLQIWDTAGQESFRSITRAYYRGSSVAFLVFDITNRDSFQNVLSWYEDIKNFSNKNYIIYLVGNKKDLDDKRKIAYEEAQMFAEEHGLKYFETSAKTDINVTHIFRESAKDMYDICIEKNIYGEIGKPTPIYKTRPMHVAEKKTCKC